MASHFSERLDFLMSLTNTSNSALARELSFDASYISRIRNGKRGVPLHQPFIEPASAYFAERIREPYQIQAIEHALGLQDGWPNEHKRAAALLALWLHDESATVNPRLDRLFSVIAQPPLESDLGELSGDEGIVAPVRYYFGDAGKQAATERFLRTLIASREPVRLIAYSDESLSWFADDPAFTKRWFALMKRIIDGGGSVTIIHTITRNIGEMLDGVQNWLQLYLTGAVSSYYCPHIRDGICRRSVFVSPGRAALTSNSIGTQTEGMASELSTEPEIVAAREQELFNLLAICKPLVQATPLDDADRVNRALKKVVQAGHPEIRVFSGPDKDQELALLKRNVAHDCRKGVEQLLASASVSSTSKLPAHVIVVIVEDTGFSLVNLNGSGMALYVTERLLTAALVDYLQ